MIETIIIIAIIIMTISMIPIIIKIEELIESISKKYETETQLNKLLYEYMRQTIEQEHKK